MPDEAQRISEVLQPLHAEVFYTLIEKIFARSIIFRIFATEFIIAFYRK